MSRNRHAQHVLVVENLRIEIKSIGPGDSAADRIHKYLLENRMVFQCSENAGRKKARYVEDEAFSVIEFDVKQVAFGSPDGFYSVKHGVYGRGGMDGRARISRAIAHAT